MKDWSEENNSNRNEKVQNQTNNEQYFVAVGPKHEQSEQVDHQHLVDDPYPPGVESAVDQNQISEKYQRIHNDTGRFECTVFEAITNCQVECEVEETNPEQQIHEDACEI